MPGLVFPPQIAAPDRPVYNHLSNLIQFGNPTVNGSSADIYGGEASAEFVLTQSLTGFANYSYQEVGQAFSADVRRAVPRFKYNAGIRGDWEHINGEVGFYHYGAATYPISPAFFSFAPFGVVPPNERVSSYNLLNVRVGYRFWHQKASAGYMRDAEDAISAFNALNDRHQEYPLGDTIGSRVMGWLTLKF